MYHRIAIVCFPQDLFVNFFTTRIQVELQSELEADMGPELQLDPKNLLASVPLLSPLLASSPLLSSGSKALISLWETSPILCFFTLSACGSHNFGKGCFARYFLTTSEKIIFIPWCCIPSH